MSDRSHEFSTHMHTSFDHRITTHVQGFTNDEYTKYPQCPAMARLMNKRFSCTFPFCVRYKMSDTPVFQNEQLQRLGNIPSPLSAHSWNCIPMARCEPF